MIELRLTFSYPRFGSKRSSPFTDAAWCISQSLVVQRLRCPPVSSGIPSISSAPLPYLGSGVAEGEWHSPLSAGDRGSTPRQRAGLHFSFLAHRIDTGEGLACYSRAKRPRVIGRKDDDKGPGECAGQRWCASCVFLAAPALPTTPIYPSSQYLYHAFCLPPRSEVPRPPAFKRPLLSPLHPVICPALHAELGVLLTHTCQPTSRRITGREQEPLT
jgi:hypothetical protein